MKTEQDALEKERQETFRLTLELDNQETEMINKDIQLLKERGMKIEVESKVWELERLLKSKNDEVGSVRGAMSRIQTSTSLFLVGLTGCSMSQEQGLAVHVAEGDDIAFEWAKADVGYSLLREQLRRDA